MNIIRKLLSRLKLIKPQMVQPIVEVKLLQPHEKAKLGQGTWGRQEVKAEPKASISARVIRKDGTIEDLGIISGGN